MSRDNPISAVVTRPFGFKLPTERAGQEAFPLLDDEVF